MMGAKEILYLVAHKVAIQKLGFQQIDKGHFCADATVPFVWIFSYVCSVNLNLQQMSNLGTNFCCFFIDYFKFFLAKTTKKLTEAWSQQRSYAKTSTVLPFHNLTWNLRFLLSCFSLFWVPFEKPSCLCKTILIRSNTFAIWWLPARLVSSAPRTRRLEEHTQTLH